MTYYKGISGQKAERPIDPPEFVDLGHNPEPVESDAPRDDIDACIDKVEEQLQSMLMNLRDRMNALNAVVPARPTPVLNRAIELLQTIKEEAADNIDYATDTGSSMYFDLYPYAGEIDTCITELQGLRNDSI